MKDVLKNIYYSFPIQLLLLHFRKSQLLLIFWMILFLTVTGHFMKLFGADALFLAPEYLGSVNALSTAIVGISCGIFIMSWNITTFISHSARFRFLAATTNPFLKYCLNNAIIPIIFLIVYFSCAFSFATHNELIPVSKFFIYALSFTGGLLLVLVVSFAYFFTVDRRIIRTIQPGIINFDDDSTEPIAEEQQFEPFGLPVRNYAGAFMKFRTARNVSHYSQSFLDIIFKRHHFSAMITVLLAFIIMVFIGFFLDNRIFQVPAGASVFGMFAILVAVIGALSYFLKSWSLLFIIGLFILTNQLYQNNIIDPRNKAYGLDYAKNNRPTYSLQTLQSLSTPDKIAADEKNMLGILNKWKARQKEEKPLMILFNFSGGGLRGASFSMNVLQKLDSATKGNIMKQTMLMTGASGGMLAAAYFRELSRLRQEGHPINLQDKKYLVNISEDLLNPVFSSMIARDLIAPTQKFTYSHRRYIKDRGYAFEQKLNRNTGGLLNQNLGFYKSYESNATIPLMIFNSVVTQDLKKMMICTQPLSFMMKSAYKDSTSASTGPDAIDFASLFQNQSPMDVRLLSALRMNATYPYVLPAVWLPTNPIIDVMDAGLRDNYGQESSLRFLYVFRDWINKNTSGIMIIQVRSKQKGSWDDTDQGGSIAEIITKPVSMLQTNWFRLQDYFQDDEITYAQSFLDIPLTRVAFMYVPEKEQLGASLNFHLTGSEKKEVRLSLSRKNNVDAFRDVMHIINSAKQDE